MYEDRYDLTDAELREARDALSDLKLRGGLIDAAGQTADYRILQGKRFLVCRRGMVWRYLPAGAPDGAGPTAPRRRHSAVEMWTGRWHDTIGPDGRVAYRKTLVWVPLDDHINGHPGTPQMSWYASTKGYCHPHSAPSEPTAEDIEAIESRRARAVGIVRQRMRDVGLAAPAETRELAQPEPDDAS